jgi:alginate O-acetyltransferase complex protein AlgI
VVFSSFQFIFIFLPLVLMGAAVAQRFGDLALKLWIIAASLVFYAAWYLPYVLVLLGSILVNFVFLRLALDSKVGTARRYWVVVVGIVANICLLGWFKYAGFFAFNMNVVFGTDFPVGQIALPLGISFFTFQKIALLVDVYRRDVTEVSLLDYAMFVTFFPQLIAGPIVLFPEVHDQYREPGRMRVTPQHCVIGLSIFAVGLFKKAAIADLMATYAGPVFAAAEEGKKLGTAEAWTGVLAYTMQLYFDFSGYSDMAVGLAAMLGIVLPFNFVSPYKATSIIDFWRRWHVTLSRFLRVYLYIPLGGNRKGPLRRYINLMIVMFIGGLWHGAGWTFVAWGALHGGYLVVNHLWRTVSAQLPKPGSAASAALHAGSWLLTFIAVVIAWVFFRADSFAAATAILARMFDVAGWAEFLQHGFPTDGVLAVTGRVQTGVPRNTGYIPVVVLLVLVASLVMPNTQALFRDRLLCVYGKRLEVFPGSSSAIVWRPSRAWAIATGLMIAASFLAISKGSSPFLYFNF